MPPIGVGKRTELAAVDEGLQPLLHLLEVVGAAPRGVGNVVGQGRGLGRVGLQGADHVHPVQGVQVIEMDDVIVLVLRAMHEVANQASILGIFTPTALSTASRGQSMNVRSDPAGTLHEMLGIPGIAPLPE